MTFKPQHAARSGCPGGYTGHVDGRAARLRHRGAGRSPPACSGRDPSPDAIEARLKATARDLGAPGPDNLYGAGLVDAAAATRAGPLQVVRMIITAHGAWWETLLGTEPSRNRLAPVMPLLPTTIRSAPQLLRDVEDRVGGIALARVGCAVDAGRARPLGRLLRASRRRPRGG